uniref:Immunoglobulin V-set domain-containing protein n=1 Tax=Electrophorus electricus TaxID=8005 RepID=A0A4W4E5P0_ELEEL
MGVDIVLAGENGVKQSHSVLWAEKGNSAEMNCSHNKGASYYQMYWYRQHQGEAMELIVYTIATSSPDFGSFDKNKFSAVKKNTESGSFTSSAVYFCAAYYTTV